MSLFLPVQKCVTAKIISNTSIIFNCELRYFVTVNHKPWVDSIYLALMCIIFFRGLSGGQMPLSPELMLPRVVVNSTYHWFRQMVESYASIMQTFACFLDALQMRTSIIASLVVAYHCLHNTCFL